MVPAGEYRTAPAGAGIKRCQANSLTLDWFADIRKRPGIVDDHSKAFKMAALQR